MTAIVARQPLRPLPMSSTQRPPRRLSARLQEKDVTVGDERASEAARANGKKRKAAYDEEDDGFMFSRVKAKKQKNVTTAPPPTQEPDVANRPIASEGNGVQKEKASVGAKTKKNKMSFSTPVAAEKQAVRRSKRLSQEGEPTNPQNRARRKDDLTSKPVAEPVASNKSPAKPDSTRNNETEHKSAPQAAHHEEDSGDQHSATKIALPFADTPVIRRNKEMRENKGKKGERRSSLSLRGRRASSLIDSGTSNALPHNEVELRDFYKHIEADGLPEPRRMRQLLSWCVTRSLDQKSMGASFELSSAVAAARVIEDELLKDLGNNSELSDWFSREDVSDVPKEIPERPNPRNIQNSDKIAELEEQIRRLRAEKDALEKLLQQPTIAPLSNNGDLDSNMLSPEEATILDQLNTQKNSDINQRVNAIIDKIEPTVDKFADSVHKIVQYRNAADNVASRVLSIAAEKLAEREKESRRRAQPEDEKDRSPRRDLGSVLRGLSRADSR